jgi:hypothetical protein
LREELKDAFTVLSPMSKVSFLLRVAHMKTIYARDAYTASNDDPDGVRLREANESMHRLMGYAMDVMDGRASDAQDESVIAMNVDAFERRGASEVTLLQTWMKGVQAPDRGGRRSSDL